MEGFEEIYAKYFRQLYHFLYRLCGDDMLAEELTQETLYRAYLHIETFQGRSSLYTWLCQIGKNQWLNECRRRKHCLEKEINREEKSTYRLEEDVIHQQTLEALRRELLQLAEPYQSVVVLRVYGERSFKEIAAQYQKSESWAKVTFFRGKQMLIERMEGYR